MSLRIEDAEIRIFNPGNTDDSGSGTPDHTIPQDDIKSFSARRRAGVRRDSASATIDTRTTDHTSNVSVGDRVAIFAQLQDDVGLALQFEGYLWRYVESHPGAGNSELRLERLDDFVAGVLASRTFTGKFNDTQVSGTSSSIVNTLVNDVDDGEIDTSLVGTDTTTLDATFDGDNALEALGKLTQRTGDVMGSRENGLLWTDSASFSEQFTLSRATDVAGEVEIERDGQGLANRVRVEGAQGTTLDQTYTQNAGYVTVTDSVRKTAQTSASRSTIAQVDLYPQTFGSGDALVCRIQADDGNGDPVDIANQSADLGRDTLSASEITDNDWNTFNVNAEQVPPTFHIIAEAKPEGNGNGVDVRADDLGNGFETGSTGDDIVNYQTYIGYPVREIVRDTTSINDYRRHDAVIQAKDAKTLQEARDKGRAIIERNREPDVAVTFDARSERAHALEPTDAIGIRESNTWGVSGTFVVRSVDHAYEGNRLTTTVDTQLLRTI